MSAWLTRYLVSAFIGALFGEGRRRGTKQLQQTGPSEQENKYHEGLFDPLFPKKYRGDPEHIIFRSNWELIAFQWCDLNNNVVAWASEELAIPYRMRGVWYERHYFPDLLIYFQSAKTYMVEIKPHDQKTNPNYENRCKWAAARAYCRKKDWIFQIWDETTIEFLKAKLPPLKQAHQAADDA